MQTLELRLWNQMCRRVSFKGFVKAKLLLQVPPITMSDFASALLHVRPSVSVSDLDVYIRWNNSFGSAG